MGVERVTRSKISTRMLLVQQRDADEDHRHDEEQHQHGVVHPPLGVRLSLRPSPHHHQRGVDAGNREEDAERGADEAAERHGTRPPSEDAAEHDHADRRAGDVHHRQRPAPGAGDGHAVFPGARFPVDEMHDERGKQEGEGDDRHFGGAHPSPVEDDEGELRPRVQGEPDRAGDEHRQADAVHGRLRAGAAVGVHRPDRGGLAQRHQRRRPVGEGAEDADDQENQADDGHVCISLRARGCPGSAGSADRRRRGVERSGNGIERG